MTRIYQIPLLISLCLLTAIPALSQKLSTQEDLKRDIDQVPCKSSERLKAVVDLFKKLGAPENSIEVVEKDGTKNVVVTKKGSGTETIVIGAHYDKVSDGCGAIDNWTGVVTIAHLYRALKDYPTTKTLKFIAFDQEESGLVGSEAFVKQIPKPDRSSYCSMVNLDSFGFTQPEVFREGTSEKMLDAAKEFWTKMELKIPVMSVPGAGADSQSFTKAGIPAITFVGLNDHWQQYLHTSNDQLKYINPESVWMAYRTVLPFIADLDKRSCAEYRKN